MAKRNTGKRHEDRVTEMVSKLYPKGTVVADAKRSGHITGGKRQIDTLLHHNGELIDFEAKDHKRNVGINIVADYAFKLEDERVTKGVMVSNSPYSSTALKTGEHFNVQLTHLIDTNDQDNKFKIAQKTLIEDKIVKSLGMGINHTGFEPINISTDLGSIVILGDNDERVKAYNVFQKMWNDGLINSDDGEHTEILKKQNIVMSDGNIGTIDELCFTYIVETVYRKGEWPLEEAAGLYDVAKGAFTTNGTVTSTRLSTEEMNNWPAITRNEAEETGFGLKIACKSMLPDDPPTKSM